MSPFLVIDLLENRNLYSMD